MVVADTSVIIKWFIRDEQDVPLAIDLLEDSYRSYQRIVVPDLMFYELANFFATKKSISEGDGKGYLKDLQSLDIEVYHSDQDFISKCFQLTKKYNLSVYDAAYVVLAQDKQCHFLTADQKLIKAVNLPFVVDISTYS